MQEGDDGVPGLFDEPLAEMFFTGVERGLAGLANVDSNCCHSVKLTKQVVQFGTIIEKWTGTVN